MEKRDEIMLPFRNLWLDNRDGCGFRYIRFGTSVGSRLI
jgi:hypothetical protein